MLCFPEIEVVAVVVGGGALVVADVVTGEAVVPAEPGPPEPPTR